MLGLLGHHILHVPVFRYCILPEAVDGEDPGSHSHISTFPHFRMTKNTSKYAWAWMEGQMLPRTIVILPPQASGPVSAQLIPMDCSRRALPVTSLAGSCGMREVDPSRVQASVRHHDIEYAFDRLNECTE
jgi:hypothetical protein